MVIELFTKRKIVDIKESEDHIDVEYMNRLAKIRTRRELNDLLRDFEDFLPQGLMKFRDANDKDVEELAKQVRNYFRIIFLKKPPPSEPTEAVLLCNPPMLSIPRMMARVMSSERKKSVTWGKAFLAISSNGYLEKMIQQQERICNYIIKMKSEIEKTFDVNRKISFCVDQHSLHEFEV